MLQQIARTATAPLRLVQRACFILRAFAGGLNQESMKETDLQRRPIGLWRRQWQQSFPAVVAIECRATQAAFRLAVGDVRSDAPRSGSTGAFTAEPVTQILAAGWGFVVDNVNTHGSERRH